MTGREILQDLAVLLGRKVNRREHHTWSTSREMSSRPGVSLKSRKVDSAWRNSSAKPASGDSLTSRSVRSTDSSKISLSAASRLRRRADVAESGANDC
jgi:hypothetical protein